jgi:integrase
MSLGKQAKVLKDRDVRRLLNWIETSRYPERDKVITLLSFKAGLRAKEISRLTWGMVTGADGEIGDVIALTNSASKGKIGGREIPINGELKEALRNLRESVDVDMAAPRRPVVFSERCLDGMSPAAVADWFYHRYHDLGVEGASSHSGRRTFITMLAKNNVACGGSLRDVQQLAGHSSLATTQRYIEGDAEAKRKAIALL